MLSLYRFSLSQLSRLFISSLLLPLLLSQQWAVTWCQNLYNPEPLLHIDANSYVIHIHIYVFRCDSISCIDHRYSHSQCFWSGLRIIENFE